jgi:hypothetical protein
VRLAISRQLTMATTHEEFEAAITLLTRECNGQYPRPWMTNLTDPLSASLFIVGRNQAKGYPTDTLTHKRHLDSLFNRRGEACRKLYDEMTRSRPSPTRRNIDHLHEILKREGVDRILETNVVCYSTPMSSDLRLPEHTGGTVRGTEIFRALMHFVNPKVLIAHGSGASATLGRLLSRSLPAPPSQLAKPESTDINGMMVFVIPSLAPPMWNQWCGWADTYLSKVAKAAAKAV